MQNSVAVGGLDTRRMSPVERTRRRVLAGLAAGGAATAAACGTGATTTGGSAKEGPAKPSVAPAQLVASNWTPFDQAPAVQAFTAEFPHIKVEYAPVDFGPHYERVKASAVAGTPLDAYWLHDASVTDHAGSGLARPIDDLVRRDKDALEDIYPVAMQYFTRGGKVYGVPQFLSLFMVYYNQDRFAGSNIPQPKADWTLEQFLDAAQKLTRAPGDRPGVMLPGDVRSYYMFVKAHGGGWTDEKGTRSRLADAETVAGVQYVKDLLDKHKVAVRPQSGSDLRNQYAAGATAMLLSLNSTSLILRQAKAPFKWDVAEPPRGAKGRSTVQSATGWSLSTGGKQIDAAWQFVKWLTGERGQRLLAEREVILPSRRRVAEDPKVLTPPPANLKGISAAHTYADFYANPSVVISTPEKAKIFNDALGAALADIFADKVSTRDALSAADALVKQQGVFA